MDSRCVDANLYRYVGNSFPDSTDTAGEQDASSPTGPVNWPKTGDGWNYWNWAKNNPGPSLPRKYSLADLSTLLVTTPIGRDTYKTMMEAPTLNLAVILQPPPDDPSLHGRTSPPVGPGVPVTVRVNPIIEEPVEAAGTLVHEIVNVIGLSELYARLYEIEFYNQIRLAFGKDVMPKEYTTEPGLLTQYEDGTYSVHVPVLRDVLIDKYHYADPDEPTSNTDTKNPRNFSQEAPQDSSRNATCVAAWSKS